jgi:hypothetical protein
VSFSNTRWGDSRRMFTALAGPQPIVGVWTASASDSIYKGLPEGSIRDSAKSSANGARRT